MKIGLKERLWNGTIYQTALVRQNMVDSIKNLNPKKRKEERVTCPSYPVTVKKQITRYVAPISADTSAEVHYYARATDNCQKKVDVTDDGNPKEDGPDDKDKTGRPMLGHDNGPDFSGFATE